MTKGEIINEADWLDCTDPQKMLEFLRGKTRNRKPRLFAIACCRRIWILMHDQSSQVAFEVAERFAEGETDEEELAVARRRAQEVSNAFWETYRATGGFSDYVLYVSADAANLITGLLAGPSVRRAASLAAYASSHITPDKGLSEKTHQVALLRDLFGNPFRPILLDPAWLTWRDGTIPRLAQVIYESRQLPSGHLDRDRLAVLGDALEDSGCSDPDILGHCRGPGPHVRGCWVVDLFLGKE
jgi:hypothetical protein